MKKKEIIKRCEDLYFSIVLSVAIENKLNHEEAESMVYSNDYKISIFINQLPEKG